MRAATSLLLLSLLPLVIAGCGSDRYLVWGTEDDDDDEPAPDEAGDTGEDGGAQDGGGRGGGQGGDGGDQGDGGGDQGDGGEASSVGPGDLVVSEAMIDPTAVSDEDGEWIELYNDSDAPVKLQGLVLGDDGVDWWVVEDNATVQPGDYAVLCATAGSGANGGASCDATFHYNTWGEGFALSNSGDEIVIALPDGVVIDRVAYDGDQVVAGAALGVDPDRLGAGDNDASGAWCAQDATMAGGDQGTPGFENDPCW